MKSKNIIQRFWLVFLAIVILSAAIFLYFNPPHSINFAGLQIEYLGPDQNASVFLDNQFLEKAPLSERNILSGDYILKIVPDDQNLAEFSTPLTLTRGTLTVVSYNPSLTSKKSSATIYEVEAASNSEKVGTISFETYPEHTLLSFNQQATQYTPVILSNLAPQEYQYRVSLPSYETQEHTLQVLAGYTIRASIKLAKLADDSTSNEELGTDAQSNLITNEPDLLATESTQQNLEKDESWGVMAPELIIGNKVKIQKTGFFVDNQEVLRVRAKASQASQELGFAKSDFYYPAANNLEDNFDSSQSAQPDDWLKIKFEGQEGFVSADFAELIID
jgi:hypothetical protein